MTRVRLLAVLSTVAIAAAGISSVSVAAAAPTDTSPVSCESTQTSPFVCIPAESGEDGIGRLTVGETIQFESEVVNNGPALVDAVVTIGLPNGLQLSPLAGVERAGSWSTGRPPPDGPGSLGLGFGFGLAWHPDATLTCTSNQSADVLTCATGPIDAHTTFMVGMYLIAGPHTQRGVAAPLVVDLSSAEGQTAFAASRMSATLQVRQSAHLALTLDPPHPRIAVGQTVTIQATVHNYGPDPAPTTFAELYLNTPYLQRDQFTIVGAALPPGWPAPTPGAAILNGYWTLGTVPPGGDRTFSFAVKALRLGSTSGGFYADSDSSDFRCQENWDGLPECQSNVAITFTAVTAPTVAPAPTHSTATVAPSSTPAAVDAVSTSAPSPSRPSPISAQPTLAATGSAAPALTLAAAGLLILGGTLIFVGRGRRRIR